jgi:hypothetical protein
VKRYRKSFIREKRYLCGKTARAAKYQEIDIYPMNGSTESREHNAAAFAPRRLPTGKAQSNLNDRNARRHLTQLVITNFGLGDTHTTLTYADEFLPADDRAARRDLDNFVRRLAAVCKKRGLPAPKYIAVTEHQDADPETGTRAVRYHHHIILQCALSRDEIEKLWSRKGQPLGRANADRLQMDKGSLEALANYLLKYPRRRHRWKQSRGLAQPKTPPKADGKYTRRQVEKICKDSAILHDPDFWARKYPGWELNEAEAKYTDACGWYIYLKMRKKEVPPGGVKRKGH